MSLFKSTAELSAMSDEELSAHLALCVEACHTAWEGGEFWLPALEAAEAEQDRRLALTPQ